MFKNLLGISLIVFLANCTGFKDVSNSVQAAKPNIVIFYVDDLGYGDLSAYGAKAVNTPNIDKLAQNGIRFTDAHSSASTCTPSRYSLLTGEYAFRNDAKVLPGDAPLIIDMKKPTMATMLSSAGYQTAVVGKWHLGLGDRQSDVNWNTHIKPGPNEVGFDYSFLLPATGDRVPSVYMEDGRVVDLEPADPLKVSYVKKIGQRPAGYEQPELLRYDADPQHSDTIINGISRIGFMQGGKSAEWVDEDFYQIFTNKANAFISANSNKPFFLFFSFHDIHVPRLPAEQFLGKSDLGIRGDAIVQMDYITGQVTKHLQKLDLLDNTIIVFTSDNGPVLNDGYMDEAVQKNGKHQPAGPFRGGKYSAYEGGTRVPTILHYPKKVKPGISDSLMSQVDFFSSFAALLDIDLDPLHAIDSENHINAWLDASKNGRTILIEEAYTLSLRNEHWKYIAPSNNTGDWIANSKGIESGLMNKPQLYDLLNDPSESKNLASIYPAKARTMQMQLEKISSSSQSSANLHAQAKDSK